MHHHFAYAILMLTVLLFAASCKKVKLSSEFDQLKITQAAEKDEQLFLRSGQNVFILRGSSKKIEYSGIPIYLPDEILRDADGVWHLTKRSAALLSALTESGMFRAKVIVIDPGHGGRDSGAISVAAKAKEKDLNLDLALRIGEQLQKYGFTVYYTRDDDSTVDLGSRGGKFKADLFVSIHHNASKNISASGAETFCLLSSKEADYAKILPAVKIACEVQKSQSVASGNYGRGVKFANFRVLRDAAVPAILFETGFLTNPDDEKKCLAPEWRQIMAEAVAQGISRAVSLSEQ